MNRGTDDRPMRERLTADQAQKMVEQWNDWNGVGTEVAYTPVSTHDSNTNTKTVSKAWVLPSGIPAVMIDGISGAVSLRHVKRIE